MKRFVVGAAALVAIATGAMPADAAWNNVFQPTLFGRWRRPAVVNNYYGAPQVVAASPVVAAMPACNTCQQPPVIAASPPPAPAPSNCNQCQTNYTQRCYYQPVTTYESRSYYEPVTSYQTKYHYEPVTSYRYSCYYDPNTCSYKQMATPTTSYSLRAQSCPVQSWVQRCAQVPVTSYQKSCYMQPQTTCCTTTEGAPIPMGPTAMANPAPMMAPPQMAPPMVAPPTYANPYANPLPPVTSVPGSVPPPPSINEQRTPPPGPAGPSSGSSMFDRYYGPTGTTTKSNNTWQPAPTLAPPIPASQPAPQVKLEGIVMNPDANVRGQVVKGENAPRANADILFVSRESGQRRQVKANANGQFAVDLASGEWLVYMPTSSGAPAYHSSVNVATRQPTMLTLVNR
ncbi:MAG: hypothetical protein K2X38_03555 [Gemmataceae bacterium]|nr:hypothetical protein [Gemmataceae bacterium]